MKNIIKILALAVLFLAATDASAQQRLQKIIESGELRVGITGSQPPFSIKSKSGQLMGFDVDLANLLATSMDLRLNMVELPFGELLKNLEDGNIDLVISGMTITPERNLKAAFIGPYLISGKSLLTKSKTLSLATNPQDINQEINVVALAGSTSQSFVEKHLTNVNLVLTANQEEAISKVRKDEAEIMVADYPACAYAVLRYGADGLVMLNRPMTIEPIGIALPIDDGLFINLVDNYLESLEVSGILAKMEEKWFENPYWLLEIE